jgi:hypothetical protein
MTEQITLTLTLEELKLIDKYVELNNDTQQLFDKVKSAYPQPKMNLENEGEFDIVSYDGYVYYRLRYPTDVIWYSKSMIGRLEPIKDTKTKNELESQWLMNTEISKVLIEGEYVTIMGVKYKRVEEPKPKMNLENEGEFSLVSYNGEIYYRLEFSTAILWFIKQGNLLSDITLELVDDLETHRLLEDMWKNEVITQKDDEPYCPDEPDWYDEVEWDEKDNPNIQKIIDKMVEERKARKLWNRLHDELGLTDSACDKIVDLVEDWILDEQSYAGSQNVNTELLVEGFNDCVREMKEMLR